MSRRIPLWATLLPLLLGLFAYHLWWGQQRDAFAADLRRVLGGAVPVEVGGFPYRLEADLGTVALSRITPMVALRLSADALAVNRAPIGRPLTVVSGLKPKASFELGGIAASGFEIDAASSRSSLRLGANGIVLRLSSAFQTATIRIPAFAPPASAKSFEVHVRETPQALDPASRSPAYPEQAQLVMEGEGVRFAGGDPVGLSAQFGLDAKAPLGRDRAVLAGATLELKTATLADAHGVFATFTATASPDADGGVLVSGAVDTICPVNVAAMIAGRPGVHEFRARQPQRLAFSGTLGAVAPAGGVRDAPVRSQEPPCPVLRR